MLFLPVGVSLVCIPSGGGEGTADSTPQGLQASAGHRPAPTGSHPHPSRVLQGCGFHKRGEGCRGEWGEVGHNFNDADFLSHICL